MIVDHNAHHLELTVCGQVVRQNTNVMLPAKVADNNFIYLETAQLNIDDIINLIFQLAWSFYRF